MQFDSSLIPVAFLPEGGPWKRWQIGYLSFSNLFDLNFTSNIAHLRPGKNFSLRTRVISVKF